MPILEGIETSTSNANLKVVGEIPATQVGLMREEAVAHWGAMNKIREASVGRMVKGLVEIDPAEAKSAETVLTGHKLASDALNNGLAAAIVQMLGKQGNNSPPSTPS